MADVRISLDNLKSYNEALQEKLKNFTPTIPSDLSLNTLQTSDTATLARINILDNRGVNTVSRENLVIGYDNSTERGNGGTGHVKDCVLIGRGLRPTSYYQMVLGQYNNFTTDAVDAPLIIGWGKSDTNRLSILTVHNTGRVTLGAPPNEKMDAATKDYVDSKAKLVYSDSSYATSFVSKDLCAADTDGDYYVSGGKYVTGTFVQIDTVTDWLDESAYLYIIDFRYNAQNYTQSLIYTPFKKDASNTVLTAGGDGLFLQRLGVPSNSGSVLAGAHNVFLCCPSATTITLGKVTKIKLA